LLACALLPAAASVAAADSHRAKPNAKAVQAKAGKPTPKPVAARSIDALDRAREAYARGDLATLQMLLPQVADQPLGDYVLLWSLTQRLGRSTETVLPQEIDAFLSRHGDDALGERLRRELLRAAVRDGRWSEALRHYRALVKPDREAQCWGTLAWIQDQPQSGVPTNDVLRLLVSAPRPGTECLPLNAAAAFQGRLDRQTLR
jgi:soluble lytic murein transglycosylase